ncbi:MerR family transcriptional regulator [Agromyces sp. MMS24-K17]|uniref:MerR family transcriptional regulator n=1 Tax=Agromyces sp. MMS24-K17 TaxID=3372850 RepID=UPI003753ECA1
MRIGDLAARTGVSARRLRYYEQQGLIASERRANGYRDYAEGSVERVEQVSGLIEAGVPTAVIADMIPCLAQTSHPKAPVIERTQADTLERRRAQLDARIDALIRNRDAIDAYLDRATITG